MPMTFFDSSKASYSSMRQDLNRYVKAVRSKQEDVQDLLNRITAWKLATWSNVEDPDTGISMLTLPRNMTVRDITWEWVPDGIPWVDPVKEVTADMLAISAGFRTRDDVCRERYGTRYRDVVAKLGREEQAAIDASATLAIGQPGQITTRDEELGQPANEQETE
jgi:capsid protein